MFVSDPVETFGKIGICLESTHSRILVCDVSIIFLGAPLIRLDLEKNQIATHLFSENPQS